MSRRGIEREIENGLMVARMEGRGMGVTLKRYGVSSGSHENVLKLDSGYGFTTF